MKAILAEDFANRDMGALAKEHGGLVTPAPGKCRATFDARTQLGSYDLAYAIPKGYLDEEQWNGIGDMFNIFRPIAEQVVYCRDGGVIVFDNEMNKEPKAEGEKYITAQKMKTSKRLDNYLQDKGEDENSRWRMGKGTPLGNLYDTERKRNHYERRGIRTTGPNAGQERVKK